MNNFEWWESPEYKSTFEFPISIVKDDETWVVSCNSETEVLLGERMSTAGQGKTREEAISEMFRLMKMTHAYSEECRLSYQRFVPFRYGPWKRVGGRWFAVFGIHVFFRHGKGMKGGWYIPFTKLNISVSSDWLVYKRFKKENQ